jgi:hypothetical protein
VFCTFVCLPFSVGNWKVTRLSERDLRERERDSWEGAGWQDLPIFY